MLVPVDREYLLWLADHAERDFRSRTAGHGMSPEQKRMVELMRRLVERVGSAEYEWDTANVDSYAGAVNTALSWVGSTHELYLRECTASQT